MRLYTLPSATEQVFTDYIAANYTGSYPVFKGFCMDTVVFPSIVVEASEFSQYEPDTHLYKGTAQVFVTTQIDDVADPITAHDNEAAAVYDLFADKAALAAFCNASGDNFQLINADFATFRRSRAEQPTRALMSVLELELFCQTLET